MAEVAALLAPALPIVLIVGGVAALLVQERQLVVKMRQEAAARSLFDEDELLDVFMAGEPRDASRSALVLAFLQDVAAAKKVDVGRLRPYDCLGAPAELHRLFAPVTAAIDDEILWCVLPRYTFVVDLEGEVCRRRIDEVVAVLSGKTP
jgi:hypothetical protein